MEGATLVEEVGRMMNLVDGMAAASFGQIVLAASVATLATLVMRRRV